MTTSNSRNLIDDRRGAIMVLGIMLGAFLVGVVFHLSSVGHAILWREFAQDAADATAYEAALWNARGMNVIVAVNIFMAVIMSILMFWRLVFIFVVAALALSAIGCGFSWVPGLQWLGILCSAVGPLTSATSWMTRQDHKVSGAVYKVLIVLHKQQVRVASATPVLSASMSSAKILGDKQYDDIDIAVGLGMQLLPSNILPSSPSKREKDESLPCGVKSNGGGGEDFSLLGSPVSLPVQQDSIDTVCEKGAVVQGRIITILFRRVGEATGLGFLENMSDGWVKIWEFVVGHLLGDIMCKDIAGVVEEKLEQIIDKQCNCDDIKHKEGKKDQAYKTCLKNRSRCESDARDRTKNKAKGKPGRVNSNDVKASKVWEFSGNGDLFMQSWGIVQSERSWMERTADTIKLANSFGGDPGDITELDTKEWVIGGAEMFFGCDKGWGECREACDYTVGWRARLRRVHDPLEYAAGFAEKVLVETFWNQLQTGIFKGPVGAAIGKVQSKVGFSGNLLSGMVLKVGIDELEERTKSEIYETQAISGAARRAHDTIRGEGRGPVIH